MRDSGQYDLLIWNVLVANTGDPENYLRENWYSSSANNTAGYNNPDVDKLLDELAQTFDEDARKDLIIGGISCGICLCLATNFQQFGI